MLNELNIKKMTTTTANNIQIAKTIINQIGNKALYMIGAKNIVASENGGDNQKL